VFIGHFALGYAAKRWAPRLSLAVLFAAAVFADVLWPVLVALGIEQVRIVPGFTAFTPLEFISYPYSHSLLTLLLWGAVFGLACARDNARAFLVVLGLVVSHWVLDFITHVPDMPLYPGGPKFGLGLWNSISATLAVEALMFAAGVWIYTRVTRSRDAIGRWAFVGITAFLAIGFVANVNAPPPPSITALWVVALALSALTLSLAWWADKHRDFAARD
jgi:LexA-binding, inner membrane-associated putative hydrolase